MQTGESGKEVLITPSAVQHLAQVLLTQEAMPELEAVVRLEVLLQMLHDDASLHDLVHRVRNQLQRGLILHVLESTYGDTVEAAKRLRITREALHHEMQIYNLSYGRSDDEV
jgi:DNA-binding NtrC family response regulator